MDAVERSHKTEARARWMWALSVVCLGLAVLIFFGAWYSAIQSDDPLGLQRRGFSVSALLSCAVFVVIGMWSQIIAQLLYIRAALERRG